MGAKGEHGVYLHKGSDIWQMSVQVDGKRRSKSSRTRSRVEALALAETLRDELRAEIAAENVAGPSVTFDQAARKYYDNARDPRPFDSFTKDEKRRQRELWDQIEQACTLAGPSTPCCAIDTARMIEIRQNLRASPARTASGFPQNGTVNRKLEKIFAILNTAMGHMSCPLPDRPRMRDVRLPESDRDHTISYDDENAICCHLREDHHAPFAFELETGLRRGDIVGLRWKSVNFDAKKVVGRRKSSGVKTYDVRLNPRALEILEQMRRETGGGPNDFVFTRFETRTEIHDGVPVSTTVRIPLGSGSVFGRVMKKAFIAAGLGHLVFHDMRRTAGTRHYLSSRSYESTRQFLGHSSIHVTKKYIKISVENVAIGVELMDRDRAGRGWKLKATTAPTPRRGRRLKTAA